MASNAAFAEIAALAGDPARAGMLHALMDGRALTSSELAHVAGVTPQTAWNCSIASASMLMPSALAAAAGDPASFAGLVLTGANGGRTSRAPSERRFARTGSRAAGYAASTIPARSRSRRRGSASCASSSGFACRLFRNS